MLHSFGPISSYEDMEEFDVEEIRESMALGRFVRVHLSFFPPIVSMCQGYLDGLEKRQAAKLSKDGLAAIE